MVERTGRLFASRAHTIGPVPRTKNLSLIQDMQTLACQSHIYSLSRVQGVLASASCSVMGVSVGAHISIPVVLAALGQVGKYQSDIHTHANHHKTLCARLKASTGMLASRLASFSRPWVFTAAKHATFLLTGVLDGNKRSPSLHRSSPLARGHMPSSRIQRGTFVMVDCSSCNLR
jgi:hypothetical protein